MPNPNSSFQVLKSLIDIFKVAQYMNFIYLDVFRNELDFEYFINRFKF